MFAAGFWNTKKNRNIFRKQIDPKGVIIAGGIDRCIDFRVFSFVFIYQGDNVMLMCSE